MNEKEMTKELNKPLDPSTVSSRKEGYGQVSYLETWVVINTANRIFGYDWDFVIDSVKEVWSGEVKDRLEVSYICQGHVIVDQVLHYDVGYGNGMNKQGNMGACHELASKEAVSDCMKRCLRAWGNQFGNSLYDKKKAWEQPPVQVIELTEKAKFCKSVRSLKLSKAPVAKIEWEAYITELCFKSEEKIASVGSIEDNSPLWAKISTKAKELHTLDVPKDKE